MRNLIAISLVLCLVIAASAVEKDIQLVLKDNGLELISTPDIFVLRFIDKRSRPFIAISKGGRVGLPQDLEMEIFESKTGTKAHEARAIEYTLSQVWKRARNNMEKCALLYRLKIDQDLDSKTDLEIYPGGYDVAGSGEIGLSFNEVTRFSGCKLMPYYTRAEVQLHKADGESSLYRKGPLSINRVIIRRHSDGNLQLTLRDGMFHTGPPIVLETEFTWE